MCTYRGQRLINLLLCSPSFRGCTRELAWKKCLSLNLMINSLVILAGQWVPGIHSPAQTCISVPRSSYGFWGALCWINHLHSSLKIFFKELCIKGKGQNADSVENISSLDTHRKGCVIIYLYIYPDYLGGHKYVCLRMAKENKPPYPFLNSIMPDIY